MISKSASRYGTNKEAVIYHCPSPMRAVSNPFHIQWEQAISTCLNDPELVGRGRGLSDLTVITYNTQPEPGLLERCVERLGYAGLVVLGRGLTRWSWAHKITLVHDYLSSGACVTPNVLCLDGDDVIIVGDPNVAVQRFESTGAEMIFCGTRGDQPASPECWDFENRVGRNLDPLHRHLNAGGYLGRTGYVTARLAEIAQAVETGASWCRADGHVDDQLAWRQLHRREHPKIIIDAECRLFLRFDEDR